MVEWLRGALAELPESQAQAFSLVCVGELSYQEAAAQMNVERNHVPFSCIEHAPDCVNS